MTMVIRKPAAALLFVALAASAQAADLLPPERPIAEVIDHYVDAKLKTAGVTPAPQVDDATFVRRLTLDLAGRIPTAAEARQFVASTDPAKRQQLIVRLVVSPWFERHTATEFNTLLRGHDGSGPDLRKYLLAAVKENRPWNRMFRELLGDGTDPLGPEQFILKRTADLDRLARDTSSMFFGINISCCQCHTHPFVDTLTQNSFHGMKAFFSRCYEFQGRLMEKRFGPVTLEYQNRGGEKSQVAMLFLSGESLPLPDPGVPDLAKAIAEETKEIEALKKDFAKNKAYPPAAEFSPREQLLKVVEKPENQMMMARSLLNQLWFRLYGYGLVMRVDQMQKENPGSHPELLEWLSRDLIAHQWDLRRTISGLVASRAYARSSRWAEPPPAPDLFAVAALRPLTPMQFGLSVLMAGDETLDAASPADLAKKIESLEAGARSFETLLEQPRAEGFEISVREPLGISNDPARLKVIGAALVPGLLKLADVRQQVEAATWALLSRAPTDSERELLSEFIHGHSTLPAAERARLEQAIVERKQQAEAARARLTALDAAITAPGGRGVLVPASAPGWKYVVVSQLKDEAWLKTEFDDAAWKSAKSPVGHGSPLLGEKQGDTLDAKEGDIAFRRTFEIDGTQWFNASRLLLEVAADDSAAVYLNGKLLDDDKTSHAARYWNRSIEVSADSLSPGRNTLAVRLRNAAGDGFLDVRLSSLTEQESLDRAKLLTTISAPSPAVPSDADLRRKALENMVWAFVAGSEFRFNY